MGRVARANAAAKAATTSGERFFYHSFPRRGTGSTSVGLAVLRSMVESGFLLAPETLEWQEPLMDGKSSEPFLVAQKRICFTELSPTELPEHSRRFGPFSLEFSIENLRRLGAIPVFYVPRGTTDDHLESVGNAMMARMLEIEQLLQRLAELSKAVAAAQDDSETVAITVNGRAVGALSMNVGQARSLMSVLFAKSQPPEQLLNTLRATAGFFYPTESPGLTGTLGYYRQREWRIVSAMMHKNVELSRPLTSDEISFLENMDPSFWASEQAFRTGPSTRARQSQYMKQVSGKHVLNYARRLHCPLDAVGEATRILEQLDSPPVVIGN